MSVDSTALLNARHLDADARDGRWLRAFPGEGEELSFDHVRLYRAQKRPARPRGGDPVITGDPVMDNRDDFLFDCEMLDDDGAISSRDKTTAVKKTSRQKPRDDGGDEAGGPLLSESVLLAGEELEEEANSAPFELLIVSYGNGVPAALRAAESLAARGQVPPRGIAVVDCPYLSAPPAGLRAALRATRRAVFADVCKEGQHPFASFITVRPPSPPPSRESRFDAIARGKF